jgi:Asp-tRNA(Asn)/Glu-tRNA(Gln) amidotransferase A subunit family amidase
MALKTMRMLRRQAAILAAFLLLAALPAAQAAKLDLATATIPELQAAMQKGTLSSEKLMQLYLARIKAYDQQGPKLNAIILLSKDPLADARAMDAERKAKGPRGPLHGIPILVKDVYDVAGLPTAGGFKPMANSFPAHDAFVIAKLRAAGAIVFGKLNQSDWFGVAPRAGSTLAGQVHNPYDLTRIPGSSSSGTGAAVASWFCAAGLGSDTGGSVQTPSSDSNLYGMVATRGAISRTGQIASSVTQERAGPIARSMTDLAIMLTTMVGFDAEDLVTRDGLGRLPAEPYTSFLKKDALNGARIGVLRSLFRGGQEFAEGYRLADESLARLKGAGAVLVDPVGVDFDLVKALNDSGVSMYERKPTHNWYLSRLPVDAPIHSVDEMIAKAGDIVVPAIKESAALPPLDHYAPYLARLKQQEMIRNALIALMDRYQLDALVYPYKTSPPAKIVGADVGRAPDETAAGSANISANTGLPALVAPMGLTSDGLPIGLELLGRPFSEPALIGFGYAYEQASPARRPPPTVPALPGEAFTE